MLTLVNFIKKRYKMLLSLVLLVAVFGCGVALGRPKQQATPVSAELISQRLEALCELSTVSYHYTNMARYENSLDLNGWTIPLTQKSFILSYDGEIKAGVDLALAQVEIAGTTISITLPAATILSHEIDDDSLEVYDESNNLFNPISVTDYTAFSAQQKEKIELQATEKGLLAQAEQNARNAVSQMLQLFSDQLGAYKVDIH